MSLMKTRYLRLLQMQSIKRTVETGVKSSKSVNPSRMPLIKVVLRSEKSSKTLVNDENALMLVLSRRPSDVVAGPSSSSQTIPVSHSREQEEYRYIDRDALEEGIEDFSLNSDRTSD